MAAAALDRAELKRLKEEFVSNLSGTSKWEIFCLIGCLPVTMIFADAAKAWLAAHVDGLPSSRTGSARYRLSNFVLEMAVVVAPQVALAMSVGDPGPVFLTLLLLWISLIFKLWVRFKRRPQARAARSRARAAAAGPPMRRRRRRGRRRDRRRTSARRATGPAAARPAPACEPS